MPASTRNIVLALLAAGVPIMGAFAQSENNMMVDSSAMGSTIPTDNSEDGGPSLPLQDWFDQFDHPTADPMYWGDHDQDFVDDVETEIDSRANTPYEQFEDFTQEDLTFGYDENEYAQFAGMNAEEISVAYPELTDAEVATIVKLMSIKAELDVIDEKAQMDHRMLKSQKKNKAIHFSPTETGTCRTKVAVSDFTELSNAVDNQNVDCIQLVEGNTYTWDAGVTLTIASNRHLSIFVEKSSVDRSTKKLFSKDSDSGKKVKFDKNLPTTTFQGDISATGVPMFTVEGGKLSVSDVIVRRAAGTNAAGNGQQGGFIYVYMGAVKTVNCQFFFFAAGGTISPFSLKEFKNSLSWKDVKAQTKEYDELYMKTWKAVDQKSRTKEEKVPGIFYVKGGNIFIETGTLEVIKCGFNFWTPEQLTTLGDPVANAQADPLISRLNISGGYLFVGKGQMRTKLTKFTEFMPLTSMVKTKKVTLIKLKGLLNHVTTGTLKKDLFCVFITQRGFPDQVLLGTGFLLYVGAGNAILTGGSIQYNSKFPTWIGLGGAMFVGAGNMVVTGVFYNFNEAVSTFIGLGKLLFNGAGTLIQTGSPALANYAVETFIGSATVGWLGAGVSINTGNPAEVFSGWSYRLTAGFGYFTGAGHFLLVGSPVTFANGAVAIRGTGDYGFSGTGGLSLVGSPIMDFSAFKWAFGYGLYAGQGAGYFLISGMPIFEFAAFKGCFGAGCIVANGAGLFSLHGISVRLYHGVDFTYGQGQVVFLGFGQANTVQVDVAQEYGYQMVNDGNAGVFVGQTYIREQIEGLAGRFAEYSGQAAALAQGTVSPEAVGEALYARATSVSMAGEDQIGMEINTEGSCSICASDMSTAGDNNCDVVDVCEETTIEDKEIVLFVGELTVACSTLKAVPEYPTMPESDASDETWATFRSAKSAYKTEMRDNAYGCANPQAIQKMFIEKGVDNGMVIVSLKRTVEDAEAADCSTTETYVVSVQSDDYEQALEIEQTFDAIASDLTEDVQRSAVIEEQSNICSATLGEVDMNVIKAPKPEVEITQGEFVRGGEVSVMYSFLHENGLVKANVELIRLKEGRDNSIMEQNWALGERDSSKSIQIVKNGELNDELVYNVPEDLPGGSYIFRVTGITKIGTEIVGDSEVFQLGYQPRTVDFEAESVTIGEELMIPFSGFDTNVKVTLEKQDPATDALEKMAIIKKSARGFNGNSKPVKWTIPEDIEAGDNYVIVVSPKNSKVDTDVDASLAVSKPFSIVA